jgi:hypothetical protein
MSDPHSQAFSPFTDFPLVGPIMAPLFDGLSDFIRAFYLPVTLAVWAILILLFARFIITDRSPGSEKLTVIGRCGMFGCMVPFMGFMSLSWPIYPFAILMMLSLSPAIIAIIIVIKGWEWVGKRFSIRKVKATESDSIPVLDPDQLPVPKPKRKTGHSIFRGLRKRWSSSSPSIPSSPTAKPPIPLSSTTPAAKSLPINPKQNEPATLIPQVSSIVGPQPPVKPSEVVKSPVKANNPWNDVTARQEGVIPQLPESQTVAREISSNQVMRLNHRVMQAELYKLIVVAVRSIESESDE